MPRSTSKPTALGVYIFAGGFTRGVLNAGFNVLAQLEDGPFGVETSRLNHPHVPVHATMATWPLDTFKNKVDFVYGNPPCAPWSSAGISHRRKGDDFRNKYRTDPRTSCVYAMFNVLNVVRPKVWAWESVTPALRRGWPLVRELTQAAAEMGYSTTYVLLNASDIGVPQHRYRLFTVFHKVDFEWQYPRVERHMTVREALRDVAVDVVSEMNPHSDAFEKLLPYVGEGEGLAHVFNRIYPPERRELNVRGHVKGRPAFSQFRVSWDKPSPTMIGGSHMFHPTEHRALTVRECAALCTYPHDYEFVGRTGDKYLQIARAVMPRVGNWLASNVKRAVVSNKRIRKPRVWYRNFHKGWEHEVTDLEPTPRV